GAPNEAAGYVDLAIECTDSGLAGGDRQRRHVAPGVGQVVIARDLGEHRRHGIGGLPAGDIKHVVWAKRGLNGRAGWSLGWAWLPGGGAAARRGGRRRGRRW